MADSQKRVPIINKGRKVMRSLRLLIAVLSSLAGLFSLAPLWAQELKVGYTSRTLTNIPTLWVAERQKFYDAEGLKPVHVLTGSAAVNLQALIANEIQFSATSPDLSIIANSTRGTNLKVIGGICNGAPFVIIGGKGYKTVADLKGAKLAVSSLKGGATTFLLEYLRARGLVYPKDYTLILVSGGTPVRLTAIQNGSVAASVLGSPVSDKALEMGMNKIGDIADVIPEYQFTALIVDSSWAARNRPLVVRFLKAHIRSARWIYGNLEPASRLMSEALGIELKYARIGMSYFTARKLIPPDGSVTLDGMKLNLKSLINDGAIKKDSALSLEDMVDLSYFREALAELQ